MVFTLQNLNNSSHKGGVKNAKLIFLIEFFARQLNTL